MKSLYLLPILTALFAGVGAEAACNNEDFVRSEEAAVTVAISGRGYSPACLSVKPGTQVTIQASGGHPLQGVANREGPANPFSRATEATSPETHILDASGQFRYFCTRHGDRNGNGMAGEIRVE